MISGGLKYTQCVLLFLLVTGCDSIHSPPTPQVPSLLDEKNNPDNNTQPCAFDDSVGDMPDLSALAEKKIEVAAFGKEFNGAWLAAVMKTSARATFDFVQQAGVSVYKHKETSAVCRLFQFAPLPPFDIQQDWMAAGVHRSPNTFILGKYDPQDAAGTNPSLRTHPAIVVRETTDRWTLVHEFMHHLFRIRELENGFDRLKVLGQINETWAQMDKLAVDQSGDVQTRIHQRVSLALKHAKELDLMMTQYALEEVAIEDHLRHSFETGDLQYVTEKSYSSGANYIRDNANQVKFIYDHLSQVYNMVNEAALEASLPEESERLSAIPDLVNQRYKEVAEARKRNVQTALSPSNASPGIMGGSSMEASPVGCSYSHEIDGILQRIRNKVSTKEPR